MEPEKVEKSAELPVAEWLGAPDESRGAAYIRPGSDVGFPALTGPAERGADYTLVRQ